MKGMSWIIIAVLLAGLGLGGFYFYQQTTELRSDLLALRQKLDRIEAFVKSEEDIRKMTRLPADANLPNVITSLNSTNAKLSAVDDSLKKEAARLDENIKKQTESIEKLNRETVAMTQKNTFDTLMAVIRGHILKVKLELSNKNVGVVKSELDLVHDMLTKAAAIATADQKRAIAEIQAALQKAKTEADTNLPAASSRVDLLWYDVVKVQNK
jgi:predicted amino acid-binding ACT domain protein